MTIQDIGSIGELVAAIATVLTLAYLAVQIRQNTAMVRASGASAHALQLNTITGMLAQDADARRVYFRGLRGEELDEDEKLHFEMLLMVYNNALQQTFQLYRQGAVAPGVWVELVRQIDWLATQPGYIPFVENWAGNMSPEFEEFIRSRIAK